MDVSPSKLRQDYTHFPASDWRGKRRVAGFTMVEVLTVVILVGILSSLAISKFLSSHARDALDGDANRLYSDLLFARNISSSTLKQHYVIFNATRKTWSIYKECNNNDKFDGSRIDSLVKIDSLSPHSRFGFSTNFTSLPAGAPSGTNGLVSTTPIRSGFGIGMALDNCLENAVTGRGSWRTTVTFCSGRGVTDVESGVLYLSTSKSNTIAWAILYNDQGAAGSYQLRRYRWGSSNWELQ
jgi:prepilin-type N-terminal cleavage/methylation domain-containing protein